MSVLSNPARQCNRNIGNAQGRGAHQAAPGQQKSQGTGLADEPGYLAHDDGEIDKPHHTIHRATTGLQLSAASFRVLHLLTHLSLFGGVLLGGDGLRALHKGANPAAQCFHRAVADLRVLSQLLPMCPADELCAFLHSLVALLPRFSAGLPGALLSVQLRDAWELAFARELVDRHLATMQQHAHGCLVANAPADSPPPLLHRLIDEDRALSKAQLPTRHPSLFCAVAVPTLDGLRAAFSASAERAARHPFIELVLTRLSTLSLVQHLWPLLEWERLLRLEWGGRLSRADAQ